MPKSPQDFLISAREKFSRSIYEGSTLLVLKMLAFCVGDILTYLEETRVIKPISLPEAILGAGAGWYCGNCKNYHGPDVSTCPEPPKSGSLRDRVGQVHNG